MRKSLFYLSLLTNLILVSCSTVLNNLPGVYSIPIQQGNIIEQSMVDQLRPNMSKRQVLYIMGSPMLDDVFHKNRWVYLYSDKPIGEDRVQKQISLFFDNEKIVGMQGDFRPSATPVVKVSTEATVDVPKRDLEKALWEKISIVVNTLVGYDELDENPSPDKPASKSEPESDQLPF
jgi:outer membrane protein assembly factor BamE